ncbi:imidazole glycerol phosphate synthase subunit HisH [Liquorilactobacillus vini]|uniref:Imidazole glycerol phosphate synthase subunit HisH n=1 Tax=Liquorilactobacillus vini DSM 20605 TaxID=1133569 RepID=A0A0R2CJH4_9LACO|nr:imidazole glycerol phosphate synthase subunit HisH [Liquorilactobacillus vini]KRM88587.1 imidazole glycerol phosphate synthase subunit HisH [Liquorilactobacillus vini DSM 20605]
MLAIIDYDAGNTYNLKKAFDYLQLETVLTADKAVIEQCQGIVLPGVGAFAPAIANLQATGLDQIIKQQVKAGKPLLGICLGMQLLFDSSTEYGWHQGLGLIPGQVVAFENRPGFKVPQMGWNQNELLQSQNPFTFLADEYTYFVHSYYANCDPQYIITQVDYAIKVPAMVKCGKIYGTQFHPEKSGQVGLQVLATFAKKVVTSA